MTKLPIIQSDKQYTAWIGEVCKRFKQSQIKASIKVNTELLRFYFNLGMDISRKGYANTYGSGFYNRLSQDLQRELPDAKGFSPTNIKYFKYFYELYSPLLTNRQQLVDDLVVSNRPQVVDDFKNTDIFEIPWGHH